MEARVCVLRESVHISVYSQRSPLVFNKNSITIQISLSLQKYLPQEGVTELNVLLRAVRAPPYILSRPAPRESMRGTARGQWVLGCWTSLQSGHLFYAPVSLSSSPGARLSELSLP